MARFLLFQGIKEFMSFHKNKEINFLNFIADRGNKAEEWGNYCEYSSAF